MTKLTKRQKEIYDFCIDYLVENQRFPSMKAISAKFEFKSFNSANDHIKALLKKGLFEDRFDKLGTTNRCIANIEISINERD